MLLVVALAELDLETAMAGVQLLGHNYYATDCSTILGLQDYLQNWLGAIITMFCTAERKL